MSYCSYVAGVRKKIKIVATILFLVVIFCIIGEVGGKTALAMTDDGTVEEKTTEEKEYQMSVRRVCNMKLYFNIAEPREFV